MTTHTKNCHCTSFGNARRNNGKANNMEVQLVACTLSLQQQVNVFMFALCLPASKGPPVGMTCAHLKAFNIIHSMLHVLPEVFLKTMTNGNNVLKKPLYHILVKVFDVFSP